MAVYRGRDLRAGRVSVPGRVYLVTTVTRCRVRAFGDWGSGACVAREIMRAGVEGRVATLAWVVMPDHLHWLLRLADEPLGAVVGRVKARSARSWNALHGVDGALWQRGFHDHAVRTRDAVRAAARYVAANPVRAGLVETIDLYPLWDVQPLPPP